MSSRNSARNNMNCGYGSADEADSLLLSPTTKPKPVITSISTQCPTKSSSINGPTNSSTNKPTLIRQCRTSTYLTTSPQLSQQTQGASDDSATGDEDGDGNMRTVPDIEVYTHSEKSDKLEKPAISISTSNNGDDQMHASTSSAAAAAMAATPSTSLSTYQLSPQNRCRACRNCDRRASTTPVSTLQFGRSVSKDSVRSAFQGTVTMSTVQHVPPVLITSSPTSGSRIIRQSSQPEASNVICCGGHICGHSHTAPNVSLRQLREPSEGIAGIAADSLRINGGMRPFKQGILLCPQTLSQSRRTRLRRAFTEATSDTMQYVKTVSSFEKQILMMYSGFSEKFKSIYKTTNTLPITKNNSILFHIK